MSQIWIKASTYADYDPEAVPRYPVIAPNEPFMAFNTTFERRYAALLLHCVVQVLITTGTGLH